MRGRLAILPLRLIPILLFTVSALVACSVPELQLASLGDLPTESGQAIHDCRVGYRTFGRLDAARSNAVLLLSPFQATSRDLAGQVGTGRLLDSSRYFVIAVDALGNGVSSSPSNAGSHSAGPFPRLSILDLVASQHALVTRVLRLERLQAVVGESMGGMQALAWAVRYPAFASRVVAIAGSPRITDGDRERLRSAVEAFRGEPAWRRALGPLRDLRIRGAVRQVQLDAADLASQAEAIMSLDLAAPFGGSLAAAAGAVRARMLVVVPARDEVVDPGPARAFAGLAGAELLVLDGRCGHQAARCEAATLAPAVGRFLASGP